jgi:tetratricopeptide (TPR) repeat protein
MKRVPESVDDAPARARSWTIRAVLLGAGAVFGIVGAALTGTWWRHNQPESRYRDGRAAVDAGDLETAHREAEYLIQTPGYEPQGRLLKGKVLVRSGLFNEALVQLERAARNEQTAVEANSTAARCLYVTGRYLEAIAAAEAALRQDPTHLDARRWLASAYYDLGAMSHAVVELQRISANAPDDPRPDRLLGLIAKDNDQYLKAIEHYKESLRRDPRQPDHEQILLELAETQIALSQFEEALATLRGSRRTANTLTLESSCRRGLGQVDEARDLLREAQELDPLYAPAKLTLGTLYIDSGDADQAVRVLKEAIRIDARNSKSHFQLSQALRQLGQVEDADAELQRMLEIQKLEREFSDLHATAAKQPDDAEVRFRLGDLARQLGKLELARMWFRAALAINPKHAQANAALLELSR